MNWEYDNLGGGKYRVRLMTKKGTTRIGKEREFEMSPDVRWQDLKVRLAQEVLALETGDKPEPIPDLEYKLDDLGDGRYRVTLLDSRKRKTSLQTEFEMPLKFTKTALKQRVAREVGRLRA